MNKVFSIALFVACAQALQYDNHHQATSYVQFNDNHNSVHHIQSAPAFIKSAQVLAAPVHAPVATVHSYSAPVLSYAAPNAAHGHVAQSYSSISHAAPSVTKVSTAPVVSHYAAPVAHYASPISKVVTPVAYAHAPAHYQQEVYAPAKYSFEYGVADHHTGDIHSHKEAREGDVTHGEYSLHEADGTVRTVKYSVDKHSGFNAVVERLGHSQHAQPAKTIVAAPLKTFVATVPHGYHH